MKKKMLIVLLCMTTAFAAKAQIIIDGRQAAFDSLTNCYLATIPEAYFGHDMSVVIDWKTDVADVAIQNHRTRGQSYTFHDIAPGKTYAITVIERTGQLSYSHLAFTFLPIVRLQGQFGYDYAPGTVLLDDPATNLTDTLTASIKWRGGTTNIDGKHKRNYKLKLSEDRQLLGMRTDNNWLLDAGQADVFRLRNKVAMDLWNDMARPPYYADREPRARNGISSVTVEVFLGDEYRGFYNLSENLDRKQTRIKKVDSQTGQIRGCLYKVKNYGYGNMNDTVDVYDNTSETWDAIEVKYPDLQDADTTDWSTLYDALRFVVMSTDEEFAAQVDQYFDLPVLIDFCIFGSVVNALDNRGKNLFWFVYDKTQDKKLSLAVWDLDCTTGQEWLLRMAEDHHLPDVLIDMGIGVVSRLSKGNVLGFNDSLNNRYRLLRQDLLSTENLIKRYRTAYESVRRSGAAEREERRWSGDSDVWGMTIDFDYEIDYICQWMTEHIKWLDGATFPLGEWVDHYETGIADRQTATTLRHDGCYTLSGQQLSGRQPARRGFYIRNGRKYIIH